jgi:hypothetical protein
MVETEAAQRGVLTAIVGLHEDRTFTEVLDEFRASVLPKYRALEVTAAEIRPVTADSSPLGRYIGYSAARRRQLAEFDEALEHWARWFRLTHDLSKTGECLPWILDFARSRCERRSFDVAPGRRRGKRGPPPWGWFLDPPNPAKESFSRWAARIRPALKEWYSDARKRQQSRSYANPAKRNPDHFRWFVLHVCGGWKPRKIIDELTLRVDDDAVRKAIKTVCEALGLKRK